MNGYRRNGERLWPCYCMSLERLAVMNHGCGDPVSRTLFEGGMEDVLVLPMRILAWPSPA